MSTATGTTTDDGGAGAATPAGSGRADVVRTLLVLVALGLLFLVARGGANRPSIVAVFILYTVLATLWVRGQYVDWLAGVPIQASPWVYVFVGVEFVVLTVLALTAGGLPDVLFVLAVTAYVVVGLLLVRSRGSGPTVGWKRWRLPRRRVGIVGVAAGVVLGALGLVLLGRADWRLVAVVLLAAGFGLLPGLALLSEDVVRRLSTATAGERRTVFTVGAVLFLVVTLSSWWLAGSALVLLAFVALGALVLAIVSSTLADVVVVLALVAFMGITPRSAELTDRIQPGQGHSSVLVALGDSYMSGEGATTFYDGTDEGGGNGCRRSPTAWAATAGQQRPFDAVHLLACSGARTYNVRTPGQGKDPTPHPQTDEPGTQLEQYEQRGDDYTAALVVLSIGGNDAGFGAIGRMCVAPGDCSEHESLWMGGLDQVEQSLRDTYAEVRAAFPDTPVVVVPYPDPIFDAEEAEVRGGSSVRAVRCDQVSLTAPERSFIARFVAGLNGRIEDAASDPALGFHYLAEMESVLADAGLQLCDPVNGGRPGLNFIGLRSVNGDPSQRFNPGNWTHNSLHPNERGHAAMLRVFQDWLHVTDLDGAVRPEGAAGAGTEGDSSSGEGSVTAACDVYGDLGELYSRADGVGCVAQGDRWALQQVGLRGLLVGAVGLVAAAGAWGASAAFFGWRRSRWPDD